VKANLPSLVVVLLILCLVAVACAPGQTSYTPIPTPAGPARPPTATPVREPFILVIMHTNDVRGYTGPCG